MTPEQVGPMLFKAHDFARMECHDHDQGSCCPAGCHEVPGSQYQHYAEVLADEPAADRTEYEAVLEQTLTVTSEPTWGTPAALEEHEALVARAQALRRRILRRTYDSAIAPRRLHLFEPAEVDPHTPIREVVGACAFLYAIHDGACRPPSVGR